MQVTRKSILTGVTRTRDIEMTQGQFAEIEAVCRIRNIQDIVPHLSETDREFIMSGIIDEEWNSLFDGWEPV